MKTRLKFKLFWLLMFIGLCSSFGILQAQDRDLSASIVYDIPSPVIWEFDIDDFTDFSTAFDQALVEYDQNSLLASYCCDDFNELPPIGAIIGGYLRAGYHQLKYSIWRNYQILFEEKAESDIPYRRYSVEQDGWRGDYVVVYKEYVEEPSLTTRLMDNTLAGLEMAAVVPSSHSVMTLMAKSPGVFSVEMMREVTEKFRNFECVECVEAIVKKLKDVGISGEIIELKARGNTSRMAGNVYSETLGKIVSTNGRHQGVLVEGKVYDNIHKEGINFQDWIDDFDSPLGLDLFKTDF